VLVGTRPSGRAIGSPGAARRTATTNQRETRFTSQVRRAPATRRSNRTILTDPTREVQIRAPVSRSFTWPTNGPVLQPVAAWPCLIDVTRHSPRLVARLALAAACVALAGCGVAGPEARTFVGPVTAVSHDAVCIGGANASGECFVEDKNTWNLRVSECIRVTYTPDGSQAYATATTVEHLDAATHKTDCPRQ
jgi:hypothetical protein